MKDVLGGIVAVLFIIAFIAVMYVILVRVGLFAQEPFYQQGFSGQVSGLVSEYCTAPRPADREGARQQMSNLLDREPGRSDSLPTELRRKARAVQDNRREEACR